MAPDTTYKNINIVDEKRLCTECGTCWGICPKKNIRVTEIKDGRLRFQVDYPSRCGNCSLCIQVCPGMDVDFRQLNEDVFKAQKDLEPWNEDIGQYKTLFLGHAVDDTIRQGGASGGVTTAILAGAIDEYDLDGVFVAKMGGSSSGSPLAATIYLAADKSDLLQGQQSKYTTVPMGKCLREIIYQGRGKRFAFVGLGCHIQALRKAERIFPVLKKRIMLRVGLVCGHCMDWRGTRHLFDLLEVEEKDVKKIEFRSGQWPGNFKVTLKDGQSRKIGQIDWTSYVMTLYEKHRCHFCTDPLNQLSDISTGDPWLNELAHEPGLNLVIGRTDAGARFLTRAVSEGYIQTQPTEKEKIVRSQRRSLYRKRYVNRAYMKLTKLAGSSVPEYTGQFDSSKLTWREYREASILIFFRFLSEQPALRRLLAFSGRLFVSYMDRRRKTTGRMVLK